MRLAVDLAAKVLRQEGVTLAICRGSSVLYTSRNRGIDDLYCLVKKRPELLAGASAADKIVGKAAAILYIGSGIQELYADNISRSAVGLLRKAGVKVQYQKLIPFVMNRDRSGMCPVERLASTVDTMAQLMDVLHHFYKERDICG